MSMPCLSLSMTILEHGLDPRKSLIQKAMAPASRRKSIYASSASVVDCSKQPPKQRSSKTSQINLKVTITKKKAYSKPSRFSHLLPNFNTHVQLNLELLLLSLHTLSSCRRSLCGSLWRLHTLALLPKYSKPYLVYDTASRRRHLRDSRICGETALEHRGPRLPAASLHHPIHPHLDRASAVVCQHLHGARAYRNRRPRRSSVSHQQAVLNGYFCPRRLYLFHGPVDW